MRLVNTTAWRTDHLRRFISNLVKEQAGPATQRRLRFEVKPAASLDVRYAGSTVLVGLPKGAVDRAQMAHMIAHCIACVGGHHGIARFGGASWRQHYAWAAHVSLEQRAVPNRDRCKGRCAVCDLADSLGVKPPRHTDHASRRAVAERRIKTWERKAKLAATKLKLWRRRLKAVERAMAKRAEAQ